MTSYDNFLANFCISDLNSMKYLIISGIMFCLLFLSPPSFAGIYRFVDDKGVVHFTNCPKDPKFKLYIRESKEDIGNDKHSSSFSYIRDSNQYDSLISELSNKHQVDFALIKAIIRAESGFNPSAVSRKGAKGLMQLMPETAMRMNVSNVFNPRENIDGGVRYFKYLLSVFNDDLRLSLAAYNAGENVVGELRSIPPYRETADYVKKVLSFYQSYRP